MKRVSVRKLEKERDELARSLKEAWSENEKAWAILRDERAKVSKLQADLVVKHLQDSNAQWEREMGKFAVEMARALASRN